jgi:hypothetical protein
LTVLPSAVDEVTAVLAQEQPRADKVATLTFLSNLGADATTWTFQTFDDNTARKAGHLARTPDRSLRVSKKKKSPKNARSWRVSCIHDKHELIQPTNSSNNCFRFKRVRMFIGACRR